MRGRKALIFPLAWLLSGCQNPAGQAEKVAAEFIRKNPNHVVSFAGAHRKMRAVWSGDPRQRPIVFVHGSPGSWDGWAEYVSDERFQRRFHLIAVDRPGYGGSGEGRSEPSLKRQAEDVLTALSLNQSGKSAVLVGHSYGGPVVAKAAILASDRVGALLFIASSVDPNLEETKWFQIPAAWWPIRHLIPTALRVCNEEILALKDELQMLDRDWESITQIRAILHGTADPLVPDGNRSYILTKSAADRIVFDRLLPGVNHFIPWNQRSQVIEAIEALEIALGAAETPREN